MKARLGFGLAQEKWTRAFLAGGRRVHEHRRDCGVQVRAEQGEKPS